MIHNIVRTPSCAPVRVEVRKYFGYSLVEVMDLARGLLTRFARHLVKPMPLHGRLRPAAYRTRSHRFEPTSGTSWSQRKVPMYYVSVPHASPQLLSVKTMQQSDVGSKVRWSGLQLKMALRWEDGRLTIRDQC
jgi:hypothetical protein